MPIVTCGVCGFENVASARFCGGCAMVVGEARTHTGAHSGGVSVAPGLAGGAASDRSGEVLGGGRYRLERLLGAGGMGAVYEAWDHRFELRVALKLLAPHLLGSPRVHERMLHEARAMARINHANVVRVFDVFEAESGELVLVLELVEGGDLGARVTAGGLPWPQVRGLMEGLLAGLSAIHGAGLVHRDIKPANVLLSGEGGAKVTDLGIAREVDGRLKTETGLALGTVGYMSPEQVRGQKVDSRSDIYSAGVVLFELVSGRLPFEAESDFDLQAAHVQAEPDWFALPEVTGLKEVLSRALAKDPDARWPSAAALRAALAGVDAGVVDAGDGAQTVDPYGAAARQPAARQVPALPPKARPGRVRWTTILAGALLAGAAALAFLLLDDANTGADTPPEATSLGAAAASAPGSTAALPPITAPTASIVETAAVSPATDAPVELRPLERRPAATPPTVMVPARLSRLEALRLPATATSAAAATTHPAARVPVTLGTTAPLRRLDALLQPSAPARPARSTPAGSIRKQEAQQPAPVLRPLPSRNSERGAARPTSPKVAPGGKAGLRQPLAPSTAFRLPGRPGSPARVGATAPKPSAAKVLRRRPRPVRR